MACQKPLEQPQIENPAQRPAGRTPGARSKGIVDLYMYIYVCVSQPTDIRAYDGHG